VQEDDSRYGTVEHIIEIRDQTACTSQYLMMQFAIASMNKVVKTANKIAEQERKPTIANSLIAFLMFIPIAGYTADALGAIMLRTIINVSDEPANISVAIYKVVEDPNNALLSVLSFLLRGVSPKPCKKVAQARRSMKDGEFEKLGPIKNDLKRIGTLKGKVLGCEKS
jgi:hypothetical protein